MKRTSTRQQRLLAAMLEEARQRSEQGLPIREIVLHVKQVRRDLSSASQQGVTITLPPQSP